MKFNPLLVLLPLIFGCSAAIYAQEEFDVSIADKTEQPGLLKKGEGQAEVGFLHNSFSSGHAAEIGQLLLRYGVTEAVEIRLLAEDGRELSRYMEETVQSTYPLAAGMKIALAKHRGWLPDVALVGYIHLPFTAHSKQQQAYWSPMMYLAFEHKISEKFSLDYNAGAQQEAFGTAWQGLFNSSVHYALTDALDAFAEYFAQYEPLELPQHNLGAGLSYSVNKHLAVYAAGGTTIFYSEANHFFTGGLAVKLP